MMKKYFLLLFSIPTMLSIYGQVSDQIPGVYSLTGVMETASAFKLNRDSTFEFYFSYGALDRYGTGNWSIVNKLMVLNSKPYPGKDFKLIDSSLTENNFTTIQIKDKNSHLYRFVYCFSKTPTGDSLLNANDGGIIILPGKPDTINLFSELSPERMSGFIVDHTKSNSYTFGFEPWALEVFFKNFTLQFVNGHLEGTHPLLKDEKYTYIKEE